MKKKIMFLTGSRAEYGLLKNLIRNFIDDKDYQLFLVVTGSHLSDKFGKTSKEITLDGNRISKKIILPLKDSAHGVLISISQLVDKFSIYLKKVNPDVLVLLGDRYEVFAAALVAHIYNVKVAHIHGGELTEGSFDDALRHSITKMSSLHFTSCEEYKNRVIQLGEHPKTVHNVGSLGLDAIQRIKFKSKKNLEAELGIKFISKNILVTFHPETKSSRVKNKQNLLALIKALSSLKGTSIIFTGVNADEGFEQYKTLIQRFCSKFENASYFPSLGQTNYFSCLKFVDMVVGNSSSGIIEVPAFNIPTVNIGIRQKGRSQDPSIINCDPDEASIISSIRKAYKQNTKKNINLIYKKRNSAKKIYQVIKSTSFLAKTKSFYDLEINT